VDPQAANRILSEALAVGPRCGPVILIGIDGRSGSGKTTLAEQISELAELQGLRTAVVHNDLLCPGWDGLPEVPSRLNALVAQLAEFGSATYPTWDWIAGQPGDDAQIPTSDVVIIEGVAAIDPQWAGRRSISIWVEAPTPLRKVRAIERDGDNFAAHWDAWAASENRYYESAPRHPDVIVDAS